jgi:hypothetical protein
MDALQHSIAGALEAEQKKTQVNDAKLRAVSQRVDYDDFCKMVAGAHLKPVKPCSAGSRDISKPFDQFVLPKYEPAVADRGSAMASASAAAAAFEKPADLNDFTRTWRRRCKTDVDKLKYLRVLDTDALPVLFRIEMDPVLLDGIVGALHTALCAAADDGDGDTAQLGVWAYRLLAGVARVNRMETTLAIAANETAQSLAALFDAILALAPAAGVGAEGEIDADAVRALRAKYRI